VPETAGHVRDVATYITKLPKAEHDADEWQAAMEALLLVVEHGGPPRCTIATARRVRKARPGSSADHFRRCIWGVLKVYS
jgi:hypothetical protein